MEGKDSASREEMSPGFEEDFSPSRFAKSKQHFADDDEVNDDASPSQRRGEEEEGNRDLARYEEIEEEILRFVEEKNRPWEDPDFPAVDTTVYTDPNKVPEELREIREIVWKRPKELSPGAKVTLDGKAEGEIKQGAVGVTWFMSTLLMISPKQALMDKIFVNATQETLDKGYCCFQFFKNGEWKQIFIDTRLPYDPQSKSLLFGQCADPNEYWIPLLEKAYAKLHGGYENIITGHIANALVDLTGFTSEKYNLAEEEVKEMAENYKLWDIIKNAFNQKFILGCINAVKGKNLKNPEVGPHGILENHGYAIIDVKEFPNDDKLKLVKIRNPWGPDANWHGPFSDDSEEWDRYRHLRDLLKPTFKTKKADGTCWMKFEDLIHNFNKIYICRVFPENWQIFSIDSRWKGKTAGGSWKVLPKIPEAEHSKTIQADSDEKWFNNPQFRIVIKRDIKLFVTLMQEDIILSKNEYVPINILIAKDPGHRLWERPHKDTIIFESIYDVQKNKKREIGALLTLKKDEEKKSASFIIVPNNETTERKDEQRAFWLRLFASEEIELEELRETIETSVEGNWTEITAGGRLKTKEGRDNPDWCRNPQYFLNLKEPTHFKIILKRTNKKSKNTKLGLCITRHDQHENRIIKGKQHGSEKKQAYNSAIEKYLLVKRFKKRLLAQSTELLVPPTLGVVQRRLNIGLQEPYKESTFGSEDVAALYFFKNPTEGPFIIVPCMEEKDKPCSYRLTIYSSKPIELLQLSESQNAVYIGKWDELSAGGSHLNELYEKDQAKKTWADNPKYSLKFLSPGPVEFKVTLQVAEKNWKAKIAKKNMSSSAGMIGIYVLVNTDTKVKYTDKIGSESGPTFFPTLEVTEQFAERETPPKGYIVMPTTYEAKLEGNYIISVHADRDFEFMKI